MSEAIPRAAAPAVLHRRFKRDDGAVDAVCRHCHSRIRRRYWGDLGWGRWFHVLTGNRECGGLS